MFNTGNLYLIVNCTKKGINTKYFIELIKGGDRPYRLIVKITKSTSRYSDCHLKEKMAFHISLNQGRKFLIPWAWFYFSTGNIQYLVSLISRPILRVLFLYGVWHSKGIFWWPKVENVYGLLSWVSDSWDCKRYCLPCPSKIAILLTIFPKSHVSMCYTTIAA